MQYHKSLQNKHFVRAFTEKASKRIVSTRLPSNFTEEASKTSVSKDRHFSQKKLPKGAFLAMSLTIFTEKIVSERAFRVMLPTIVTKNLRFATVLAQSTLGFLREGSSARSHLCLALQRCAFPKVTMCVSPQRREQKCMNLSTLNDRFAH